MDASEMQRREMLDRCDGDDAPEDGGDGRSLAAPSSGGGASSAGPLAPGQRWSVARKRAVVLRLIAGESVELVAREIGVPVFKLERWREKAEAALEGALKERETGADGAELAAALQRVGELSMENELLRAKMGRSPGPLARRRSR
jgi:transposase-like protein